MTDWDARFLSLAEHVATWSKDPSTKVGAVIVRPDRTVSSIGFNGFPRRIEDDARLADRELKYQLIVHGEANALLSAREPLHGHTLYTFPFMPCSRCAGLVIQAGIARVVAPKSTSQRWEQNFDLARSLFCEAGIILLEM